MTAFYSATRRSARPAAWRRTTSPSSIAQCHRILSRALKVAVQRDRVARNVCTLVDSPTIDRHEVEPLTADEARAILTAAVGTRNAARWSVALALGLRQGEALGLANDGALRVRTAEGERVFHAGEVSVRAQ